MGGPSRLQVCELLSKNNSLYPDVSFLLPVTHYHLDHSSRVSRVVPPFWLSQVVISFVGLGKDRVLNLSLGGESRGRTSRQQKNPLWPNKGKKALPKDHE
jgi:hypothetical protein